MHQFRTFLKIDEPLNKQLRSVLYVCPLTDDEIAFNSIYATLQLCMHTLLLSRDCFSQGKVTPFNTRDPYSTP